MTAVGVFCGWRNPGGVGLGFVVGRALADAGFDVVYGGDPRGCMGGVAAGAAAGGRSVYAVTTERFLAEHALPASEKVTTVRTMAERVTALSDASDGFLVLPGCVGTLRELSHVWDDYRAGEHAKPIVVCDPFGEFSGLWRYVYDGIEDLRCDRGELSAIHRTTGVTEAVTVLSGLLRARSGGLA